MKLRAADIEPGVKGDFLALVLCEMAPEMRRELADVRGDWSSVVDEGKYATLVLLQGYPSGKTATGDLLHRETELCCVYSKRV